jgi:hypothetical protein
MVLKLSLTEKTDRKRNKLWRKCGKVKNNRLEFMGAFDSRVYELGLEALEYKVRLQVLKQKIQKAK